LNKASNMSILNTSYAGSKILTDQGLAIERTDRLR
jgi:hypothetical protein